MTLDQFKALRSWLKDDATYSLALRLCSDKDAFEIRIFNGNEDSFWSISNSFFNMKIPFEKDADAIEVDPHKEKIW